MIDQNQTVNQAMTQQYSTYCIDPSRDIENRASTHSTYNERDQFFKSCKWSPDGTSILANLNDNKVRVFQPSGETFSELQDGDHQIMETIQAKEAEPIYECCWYPHMNIQDPASCCFLTSSRDHPVHLWDSNTGELRASYSVVDHRERFMGAIGLTFNLDGSSIYCGYENMIQVFDTNRPGQAIHKITTTPTRKSKNGQKGIISSLAFSPDYSGLLAAGTYNRNIGLYDAANGQLCSVFGGLDGGVTQVKFSPSGTYLFSANRQDNKITCWDIRNTGDALCHYTRPGYTNQRISFDIDSTGQVLASGDSDGNIRLFDISVMKDGGDVIEPTKLVRGHDDLVSSVSFNQVYPLLASCSGQRKFSIGNDESDDDDEVDGDDDQDQLQIDNSLKLWHLPGSWITYESQQMEVETA
ncbi:unnamed protein product [Umbelopsis ramanniana]